MIRTIYADTLEEVTKRLDRLAKKAERYGVPFSYTVGEEHPQQVAVYAIDFINNEQSVDQVYTVAAIDIDLNCEGFVKANGWKVLAHIEHGDKGNIVNAFGVEIDPAWYTAPARCDHCGTNRNRAVTFIVEHEDGTRRQVGKSCLKDYTGIAPSVALMWAEVVDLFPDLDCSREQWSERRPTPMLETRVVLAHAWDSIKAKGYRKSDDRDSTRDAVIDLLKKDAIPSEEGVKAAGELIAWLIERGQKGDAENAELTALWKEVSHGEEDDGDPRYWNRAREINNAWDHVSDLEMNCVPYARSGYLKANGIGRLCYIPVAYKKFMERKARAEALEAARAASAASSNYVGKVGDRIDFLAVRAEFITSWETQYGHTFLYKFTDENGNVYVWFASGAFEERPGMKVRGTVKNHSERDGVKQTILTRCKVS